MPFPWTLATGILTTALAFGRGVRGEIRERRRLREQFANEDLIGDGEDDVSASRRQYVVGKVATRGVVMPAIDSGVRERSRVVGGRQAIRWREVHSLTLLSAGPLAKVDEVWIDDIIAPITPDTGQTDPVRVWGTNGWTLAKRVRAYRYWDLFGAGNLRARFETLRARMDALVPGWRGTVEGDPLVIPSDLNVVTLALFDDLLAEYNALVLSASFIDWKDRRTVRVGMTNAPVNEPAVFIRLSLGADSDQLSTSAVQSYARQNVAGWRDTDLGKGMGFALNTFRYWINDGDESRRIRPWGRVPRVRYVATGAGDFDGNAAKFAKWIFLQSGREESDLEGLTEAVAFGGELIEISPMVYRKTVPTVGTVLPLEWGNYRDYLWPDGNFPPDAEELRVFNEVNARISGPTNARMRHGLNRIFNSEEINSGEALAICEERMGGSFVELSGKKVAFRPASPQSSVFTSTEKSRVSNLNIRLADQSADTSNALVATLKQDEDRMYRASTTPRSELKELVDRDGLAIRKREARGITKMIDAMRQNAFILDVDSVDKRSIETAELVEGLNDPAANIEPGQIMGLKVTGEDPALIRITHVQPRRGRTVLIGREVDSDWADDKFFPTPINRDPSPGGGGDIDLESLIDFRFRQTTEGRVADIAWNAGPDVAQFEIMAIWRERVASTPPVPDVVQHYLVDVPAEDRGSWQVHTIVEQAETDPLTVVASDADVYHFTGDVNRELGLLLFARNGNVSGRDLGRIIVPPSSVAGSPVQYKTVRETPVTDDNDIFAGWKVEIVGIEVFSGDLVYTWGGTDDDAYTLPSADTADNVHLKNLGTTQEPNWVLEIINTYELQSGWATITLASRTGSGTTQDPHVYSAGISIDVNKYVKPQDLTVEVTATPTTPGGFPGQLAYIEEEE